MSCPHPRGRNRGRVVLDEEDSMDGSEITDPMGTQDTGECLKSSLSLMYTFALLKLTRDSNS